MFKNYLFIFILIGGLTACQPPNPLIFGVPQSQWNQLTKEQQDAVIAGYNQRKQIEAVNKPIVDAISTAGNILSQQQNPGWNSAYSPPTPAWKSASPPMAQPPNIDFGQPPTLTNNPNLDPARGF